jgi:hypothetical protein
MYPSDAAGVILQTTESSAGEKSPLGARRAKIEEGVAAYAFALDDGGEGDGIVGSDGKVWVERQSGDAAAAANVPPPGAASPIAATACGVRRVVLDAEDRGLRPGATPRSARVVPASLSSIFSEKRPKMPPVVAALSASTIRERR